jgi:hypothetical protein
VRFPGTLVSLLAFVLAAACTPPPPVTLDAGPTLNPPVDAGAQDAGPPDAGAQDAGPQDAGAQDAGPQDAGPIAALGEACERNGTPPCGDGLTCLRPNPFTNAGVCQVDCAARDAQGNVTVEQPSVCMGDTTCQTVTTPTLNVLGVVCLPPVETRDALCPAPDDPDGCAGDLACLVSSSEYVTGVLFVDEARCKAPCNAANPGGDAGCPATEECLGPRSPLGTGVCGRAVELWDGAPVPDLSQQCNELSGHDYCDDRPFAGLSVPAELECVTGFYLDPHVGLCMAQCSRPRFDYDGDGNIVDADEGALLLECPTGFECDQQRARDFGLIEPVDPEIDCENFGCFPGEECAGCGTGAECVFDVMTGGSKCAAVYGFCVPIPVVDAGPQDAGPQDAGPQDAGPQDAGPRDAGLEDGGPVDAG